MFLSVFLVFAGYELLFYLKMRSVKQHNPKPNTLLNSPLHVSPEVCKKLPELISTATLRLNHTSAYFIRKLFQIIRYETILRQLVHQMIGQQHFRGPN